MSKVITIKSVSPKQTISIGKEIGRKLKGGEIIELRSDLGGGKTTFTHGLVSGSGSNDDVTSPTFTVSNEYRTAKFTIRHYDFYRLPELGLMSEELQETLNENQNVSVIEWAGDAVGLFPVSRHIIIKINSTQNITERMIEIEYPDEMDYLMQGLK